MITAEQCRAARALLNWSQVHLAEASRVGLSTIGNFEAGRSTLMAANLDAVRRAFEAAGLQFIPENGGGVGLRFTKPTSKGEGA
jgi:transcriptional regulator with XRE-family HTH domain